MEKQNYIGRKVKGFSFADKHSKLVAWNSDMIKHIGEIGTIDFYHKYGDCYSVKFENGQWNYPADLIEPHLIPEEKDETELRDQFAIHAMNSLLIHYGFRESNELLAKNSYNIADAMLKARKEVKGE